MRERGPLAVLTEMWETEYVDGGGWRGPGIGGPGCVNTTYPPLEPVSSSSSNRVAGLPSGSVFTDLGL